MERRFSGLAPELRQTDDGPTLEGYAARYYDPEDRGTAYELWSGAEERIMPGAFRVEPDAVVTFNHNDDNVLGRPEAGTARIWADDKGLRYSVRLDERRDAGLIVSLQRRDVPGSSFTFGVLGSDGERWERDGDMEVRNLVSVAVPELGPVVRPAYKATTAGLRAEGDPADARASRLRWRRQREAARARSLDLSAPTGR